MDAGRISQMAAGRLTVKSALNPLLWMCAIVGVPCFAMATYVRDDRALMWSLLAIGFMTVALASGIALRWALVSPEKLQSEDFQIRQQSLQMILQGASGREVIDVQAVVAIANPLLLGHAGEKP
jgi:hypothetical protein